MKIKFLNVVLIAFLATCSLFAQDKKYKIHTIAFYNVENLFDTVKGPNNDAEYLPKTGWTSKKYLKKLENLSKVIPGIGTNDQQKSAPTILGVSEVENRTVLEDLVKTPLMAPLDYGVIHFDSPDFRGIDVGLLYSKKHFKPTSYKNIPLYIYKNEVAIDKKDKFEDADEDKIITHSKSQRVYTRDILLVTGMLDGEEMHFLVNHWPSRSGGEKKSSPYREAAGRLNRKIMDSLFAKNPDAKIITMGDMNDGTTNKSIKVEIGAKLKKSEVQKFGFYNPFEQMAKDGHSSLFYRDSGDIFDQIIISESLIREDKSSYRYWKAGIYNKPFMIQKEGQYKGYPLRNTTAAPGYSDHFPTYIYLIKEYK